jgi:Ni,Fe-hydrogenase III small subunit
MIPFGKCNLAGEFFKKAEISEISETENPVIPTNVEVPV